MALKQNGFLPGSPMRLFGGDVLGSSRGRFAGDGAIHAQFVGGFHPTTGVPSGYRPPASFVMPIKDGGISSFSTKGTSETAALPSAFGNLGALSDGVATTAMTAFVTAERLATASGQAATAVTILAYGNLGVALSIGSQPSATDIAQAVLGGVAIESGFNLRQLMRMISAVMLGESSGGNTSFKGADSATTRVSGTVDGSGNRSAITLTPGD